jgi:CubicO group peptidase (beta-lactamase class C family)
VERAAASPGGTLTLAGGIRQGLGWMLRSDPDPACSREFSPRSFGLNGLTGTSLWCDPERDLVVALLTNRVYHGRNPEPLAQLRPAVHAAVLSAIRRR